MYNMECHNKNCRRQIIKSYICPKCKKATYCSLDCRVYDWSAGHQLSCTSEKKWTIESFTAPDEKSPKLLGRGAYGEVRLVKDRETSKLYALKVVSL
jgi:hypothetical protein